jgi:hypothetical protein
MGMSDHLVEVFYRQAYLGDDLSERSGRHISRMKRYRRHPAILMGMDAVGSFAFTDEYETHAQDYRFDFLWT